MIFKDAVYDEERALYGVHDTVVENCRFQGPADGESALNETSGLTIRNCDFLLRYPLWHTTGTTIENCCMTKTCRTALWYDKDVVIRDSSLGGIKAVRECDNIEIHDSEITSTEFGWFCCGLKMSSCSLISEYPFLRSTDMQFNRLSMKAKYSFQYVENVEIHDSRLDTKDAFWHGRNVTIYNSVIKGEYLGWYSKGLG